MTLVRAVGQALIRRHERRAGGYLYSCSVDAPVSAARWFFAQA